MTTSGNTSWELDRDEIVASAFRKIGIPGEDNDLSTTQMTNGNEALNAVIALAVTDGMPLWKRTVAQVTPSASSQVYTIADAIKVPKVYIRDVGGVQYALQNKSLYDFMMLPRGDIGLPVAWMWQPNIQGGVVSIWPLTSDTSTITNKTIQIVYQKEFDGMFSSTDTLDFPAFWTMAIIYKLAMVLAPEYGVPLADRQLLSKEAATFWDAAMGYGDEDGSFFIQAERAWDK